jgi:hypothetical protein
MINRGTPFVFRGTLCESLLVGPLYITTERFDPGRGADWTDYISWSGLTQLREVVSLDSILCPKVIDEILPEDWHHIVNEDFMLDYFTDLEYLIQRVGVLDGRNLLCLYKNPDYEQNPSDSRFALEGYDLIDVMGGVSALSNCRGFPLAFENGELNRVGLLPTLDRAVAVRARLMSNYPAEPHANCDVWAIFRLRS